jgi:hypothetical protein
MFFPSKLIVDFAYIGCNIEQAMAEKCNRDLIGGPSFEEICQGNTPSGKIIERLPKNQYSMECHLKESN